jgi:hypothetical protein
MLNYNMLECELVDLEISRGCVVILKKDLWLIGGIVTADNYDNKNEAIIPRQARGVVTFVFDDDSSQVCFTGYGNFMVEKSWLVVA